jgi:Zn-dependent protease with chaperone function
MEYAADEYAVANGMRKLESALIKIHANNLTNLMPDPWYAHYHYSHPSLAERLAHIQHLKLQQQPPPPPPSSSSSSSSSSTTEGQEENKKER